MQSIGCTLINKNHGISCDLSLTYNVGTKIGIWDRFNARSAARKVRNNLNFGDRGELIPKP